MARNAEGDEPECRRIDAVRQADKALAGGRGFGWSGMERLWGRMERTRHQSRYEEEAPHDTLPSNATLLPMRRRGGTNEQTKSSMALIFQAVEILTEYPSRASAISAYRVSVP
jgi:hypothetical protein